MKQILRRCIFRPYRKGMGPSFELKIWDTGRYDSRGQSRIGYTLRMSAHNGAKATVLLTGEDFSGSPMHADDSNETIASLMSFLTLRPGDTDPEYFAAYTPEQMAYCNEHAEALSFEVINRFGEV